MLKSIIHKCCLYFLIALFVACEEPQTILSVQTENPLVISANTGRFVGRLIANETVDVADHGFWVASQADFSDRIVISLGPINSPGRFIGMTEELVPGTRYYLKSFLLLGTETLFGNVLEFTSLSPGIVSFEPAFALPGQSISIFGANLADGARVFFGNNEAQVISSTFESRLVVTAPPITDNPNPIISVRVLGEVFSFDRPFEYIIGKYHRLNFPSLERISNAVTFQHEDKFIVLSGRLTDLSLNPNYWVYDFNSNAWEERAYPLLHHLNGFGVDGYFGGGNHRNIFGQTVQNRTFWKYQDGTFTQLENVPFHSVNSMAFFIGQYLYLMGGTDDGQRNLIYRFNTNNELWEFVGNFPFAVDKTLPYFVDGNELFYIDESKRLFAFDPLTGQRRIVSEYPGDNTLGRGMARKVGRKVLVGFYRQAIDMWELDLDSLRWKRKVNFPGNFLGENLGLFDDGMNYYILRTSVFFEPNFGYVEFWRFEPEGF